MFNSRTCQLVLGAGALQLVGLKTITAKHLGILNITRLYFKSKPHRQLSNRIIFVLLKRKSHAFAVIIFKKGVKCLTGF